MHNPRQIILSLSVFLLMLIFLPVGALSEESADSASGSIITETGSGAATLEIWQESPSTGVYSNWTLLKPGNTKVSGRHMHQIFADFPAGNYTIVVDPLEGATAFVEVSISGAIVQSNNFPRATFALDSGNNVKVTIRNIYTRTGTVSVQSKPSGASFTLSGPNDFKTSGSTPSDFQDMPEGQYTATFKQLEGCIEEQSRSDRLVKDGRITLSISLSCEGIEKLLNEQDAGKTLVYVTATVEGETVSFTDVPLGSWFAPYVNKVLRSGIMSGYKDSQGNLTGSYGPENPVSIAELAKIAHEIAGIDENEANTRPLNILARNTWFSEYFSSAEKRKWEIFRDPNLDPSRNAARAEVVATLLQALDIPRRWPSGKLFADVTIDTPFSDSIETAGYDGLVSGYNDELGNPTNLFKSDSSINRAEMAKVITKAIELYVEKTAEIQPENF